MRSQTAVLIIQTKVLTRGLSCWYAQHLLPLSHFPALLWCVGSYHVKQYMGSVVDLARWLCLWYIGQWAPGQLLTPFLPEHMGAPCGHSVYIYPLVGIFFFIVNVGEDTRGLLVKMQTREKRRESLPGKWTSTCASLAGSGTRGISLTCIYFSWLEYASEGPILWTCNATGTQVPAVQHYSNSKRQLCSQAAATSNKQQQSVPAKKPQHWEVGVGAGTDRWLINSSFHLAIYS